MSVESRTTIDSMASDSGVELDIFDEFRDHAKDTLLRLQTVSSDTIEDDGFRSVFQSVRSHVIDQAYRGDRGNVDMEALLKISGPNETHLDFEVFRPGSSQSCSVEDFEVRTRLRIKRTLLNLRELRRAFGSYQLQELEEQLNNYLEMGMKPGVLRQKLLHLSRGNNFSIYLQLKKDFLEQWNAGQKQAQGQQEATPLADSDLSDTMKALFQQKSLISKKPQVLRFTDYSFFRNFNASLHHAVHSNGLEFWKTEANRNDFHQLILAIRNKYQVEAPFHVFRFENSFTYLICGFADEGVAQSLAEDKPTAPVHAKIIMRQSNKVYRELLAADMGDQTLYFNCLKEAMLPFVEQLNDRLQINLSPSFIDFFKV